MSCKIIGIDPGASGGIAYDANGKIEAVAMPKSRRELFTFLHGITQNDCVVVIEKAQMRPNTDGAKSMVKFNSHYERVLTCLDILGVGFVEVHPLTWQSALKLARRKKKGEQKETKTERKNRFKAAAMTLNPSLKVTLKTADALLIHEHGKRQIEQDPYWVKSNSSTPEPQKSLFNG